MNIKLTKVKLEDGTRYTFTDPKDRAWKIRRGPNSIGWDLIPPACSSADWSTCNFNILRELRERLAELLQREADQEAAEYKAQLKQGHRDYIRRTVEQIPEDLKGLVEEGEQARADFIQNLNKPGDLCWHVSWARGLEADYRAKLASITLRTIKKIGLTEAIRHHREYYLERLRNNSYKGGSSSPFMNAINEIKRDVVCRYLDRLSKWVRYIDEVEKENQPGEPTCNTKTA